MKRTCRYVVLCLSLVACFSLAVRSQVDPGAHVGRVMDWTYHHVSVSGPLSTENIDRARSEPRILFRLAERNLPRAGGRQERFGGDGRGPAFPLRPKKNSMKIDWSIPLGTGIVAPTGLVSILGFIYFLEIFNPLQGGITVGLSGALFMLVPMAWFYFGQTIKPAFLETAFRLMVVLGILTSLYGIYQLTFGFPSFEQYWIDDTEFYNSISVGKVQRALATYSSAEEWGRYIEIGALIAFGFGAGAGSNPRRAGWFACGVALTGMLLLTGQRTAMFGLILGCLILLLMGARTWRGAIGRGLLVLVPVVLIAVMVTAPTNDDMLSHGDDDRMGTVVSHTARGTLNPAKEESFRCGWTTGPTWLLITFLTGRWALESVEHHWLRGALTMRTMNCRP